MEVLIRETSETKASKRTYEELVQRHYSLVKKIAYHLSAKMPSSVQLDDLIQSGMIGLLEAANKYDISKGAGFETFASIRIRGAMLDEIRKGDWGPRSVYRNRRQVTEAKRIMECRLGRMPYDSEVAEELGLSLNDYFAISQDLNGCRLYSFDDIYDSEESSLQYPCNSNLPEVDLHATKFKKTLNDSIEKLSEREQKVLSLYYEKELNLKEIGTVLGVSESRVSQIHSQAALRLRSWLHNWK